MVTKLVNVRLPMQLYTEGKEVVESEGYANFQDFLRDALRHFVQEIHKKRALRTLDKTFGCMKGQIKQLTREEKEKAAEEFVANLDKQDELLKRFGL